MLQGILFFVYSAAAVQMNLGFYPQSSGEIPTAVQSVGSKIFQIQMPYYLSLSEKEYDAMLAAEKMPQETMLAVADCKHQKRKTCVVPFLQINGTAFLGQSPDQIWTNCHIISEWMKYAGQLQTFEKSEQVRAFFSQQSLPLTLKTRDGQTIFAAQEKAHLKAFAAQAHFPIVESTCNSGDDMVKIQLSRPLAESGLNWRNGNYEGQIFMGGFPRATSSREPMGLLDSDGKSFYWTTGVALLKTGAEAVEYLSQKENLEIALAGPFLETHFAEGVEGMSGSPVLTEDGEVIGIYKGYLPLTAEQRDIPFVSLYFTTVGMRYVELLSGE